MGNNQKINIAKQHFNRAYKSHLSGKIDEAIEDYRESIKYYPTAKAYTFLGWAYSLQGKYEQAIVECLKAVEIDPNYGNPYNDIGSYLISLERSEEAIYWLRQALDKPDYETKHYAYYNLGRIYEKKGDWFGALALFNEALNYDSDYELAQKGVIRITTLLN